MLDNLFPNPGWESGDSGGWTFFSHPAGLIDVLSDVPYQGTYCLSLRRPRPGTGALARYDNPAYAQYGGRTIRFQVWYRQKTGVATNGFLAISDAVRETTVNFPVGDSLYRTHHIDHTVSPLATLLRFQLSAAPGIGNLRVDSMAAWLLYDPQIRWVVTSYTVTWRPFHWDVLVTTNIPVHLWIAYGMEKFILTTKTPDHRGLEEPKLYSWGWNAQAYLESIEASPQVEHHFDLFAYSVDGPFWFAFQEDDKARGNVYGSAIFNYSPT